MLARLFSLLTLLSSAPLAHAGGAVVHPKIDVAGQRALGTWLDDGPDGVLNTLALVAMINSGDLDGVYLDNQGVPAQRARRLGLSWWTIVPEGQLGVVLMPSQPGEAPILVLKNKVATNPEARVEALGQAWVAGATVAVGGTIPCEEGGLAPLMGSVPQQCLAVETVPPAADRAYTLTGASTGSGGSSSWPGFRFPYSHKSCLWAGQHVPFAQCVKAIGKREGFPALRPASAHGGTGIVYTGGPLTADQLVAIMEKDLTALNWNKQAAAEAKTNLRRLAGSLDEAFDLMNVDTVQARAWMLGHESGEDGGNGGRYRLHETGTEGRPYHPHWIGRGVMHITTEVNYVRSLAYMEARRQQLDADIQARFQQLFQAAAAAGAHPTLADVKHLEAGIRELQLQHAREVALRRAIQAIARDQTAAEKPEHGFLFSAGYMYGACIDRPAGIRCCLDDIKALGPSEDFDPKTSKAAFCVSGGNSTTPARGRAVYKKDAYRRAFQVLTCRNTSPDRDSCMP